jgi:hypothetical protein
MGEMDAARLAGMMAATNAQIASEIADSVNAGGSKVLTTLRNRVAAGSEFDRTLVGRIQA